MKQFLKKLAQGETLTVEQAREAFELIMTGQASEAQIGALLMGIAQRGPTVDEITGAAMAMREKCIKIDAPPDSIDTCGTGGDGSHTFNISTCAALIAAGASAHIAKHGNRSATSRSGSAEVLAELGVNIEAPPAVVSRCISEVGVGFMFAPKLHPAMKHAVGPRRQLGIVTIFNVLGPLTNPAGARRQLLGVFDGKYTQLLAEVLRNLGSQRVMIVHGTDGLDEISTIGPTQISELRDGQIQTYQLRPEQFGLRRATLADLQVEGPQQSAAAVREILEGKPGPKRDIALLNAAAALYVAGIAENLSHGLEAAAKAIDSGRAAQVLEELVRLSNEPA